MRIIKPHLTFSVFLWLSFALLSGCAVTKHQDFPVNSVNLTAVDNGDVSAVMYTLTLPPAKLVGTASTQLIEANFSGKQQQFIAQIEYSENQIALVGVSTTGIPLFDVIWRSDTPIALNQYIPLPDLDIEFIIADIQWTHWELKQLEHSVIGDNISIVEKDFPKNSEVAAAVLWQRRLLQNEQVIIEVNNFGEYFTLEHKLRNYTIKITPLKKDNK
jgi:hypothetical protein